jgi:tetratricopeptide (TPR) repeat protein
VIITEIQGELKAIPAMQELRQKILGRAEKTFDQLIRSADESKYDITVAGALQRHGDILREVGRTAEAEEKFQRAHVILSRMARESPHDPAANRNLAIILQRFGELAAARGDSANARKHNDEALQLRLKWVQLAPDSDDAKRALARSYAELGLLSLNAGDVAKAWEYYLASEKWQEAVSAEMLQDTEFKRERTGLFSRLGDVSFKLGKGAEALKYARLALDIRRPLAEGEKAPNIVARDDLAMSYIQMGDAHLLFLNDPAAARQAYEEALKLRKQLGEANPNSARVLGSQANAYYRVATACLRMGQAEEAGKLYQECLVIRKRLAESRLGAEPAVQINFSLVLARCGQHGEAAGKVDQLGGQEQIRKNPHLLYYIACVYALCSSADGQRSGSEGATSLNPDLRQRYQDAAIRTLRQAMALGWKNLIDLQTDPDLDAIRQHPDYMALVAELQQAREQDRQKSKAN